jgi:hypothetical protein
MRRDGRGWTHRVVKMARGMRGQWFEFPTAITGTDVDELKAYAERFAREQTEAGLSGSQVVVKARRGGAWVSMYRIG